MSPGDLWPPEIDTGFDASPLSVLRDQARRLGSRTNYKLLAELRTFPVGQNLRHNFEIVAPALGGYRYLLFSVTHPPELFPMTVDIDGEQSSILHDDGFTQWLRQALSSERTKKILASLFSQVDALAA
jgi:hypothetical protein